MSVQSQPKDKAPSAAAKKPAAAKKNYNTFNDNAMGNSGEAK